MAFEFELRELHSVQVQVLAYLIEHSLLLSSVMHLVNLLLESSDAENEAGFSSRSTDMERPSNNSCFLSWKAHVHRYGHIDL
jgi:hypothetical protein